MNYVNKLFLAFVVASASFTTSGHAQNMSNLGIVTGPKTGTYFQIGNDINKIISYVCRTPVAVHASAGSLDNLRRLRKQAFVQLAIVQHDVLHFARAYRQDDKELQDWVDKFRYIDTPDITLEAGISYVVVFYSGSSPGDSMILRASGLVVLPDITITGSAVKMGVTGLSMPSSGDAWDRFGPNFMVASIPEPATLLLLGTGLVGLVGLRKKFKK